MIAIVIIDSINEMKEYSRRQKKSGRSIGFVPTMGYLHEGHISLIKASRNDNDITVMSIFVNPAQFGENEDFASYPRDLERDLAMAGQAGVEAVFVPRATMMYPDGFNTYIDVRGVTEVLCGKSRPGHFTGVATIVLKLFNIIQPDKAYFGQKDAQQTVVIKQMTRDLDMDVKIIVCPIVREEDGLAMSSRNVYLSSEERRAATILFKSLNAASEMILNGQVSAKTVADSIRKMIESEPLATIDYIEILDAAKLQRVDRLKGRIIIALAVKFGSTRLIDNKILEV